LVCNKQQKQEVVEEASRLEKNMAEASALLLGAYRFGGLLCANVVFGFLRRVGVAKANTAQRILRRRAVTTFPPRPNIVTPTRRSRRCAYYLPHSFLPVDAC